jgi:outer membrane PBP1 activator LpoA protein
VSDHTRQLALGRVVGVALAALVLVGCASHGPLANAKVSQAERAVEEAQQAGAPASAPLEFRTAQDKLTTAQTLMAKGKHDQAIRAAEQATVDGEYARAVAANQRASTVAEETGQYIKVLRQEIDRLPK